MRINKGVEWAAHACALLGVLWPNKGLPLSALAEYHDLPEAYMAKQMQALSRAGIVKGGRGRRGFYELERAPDKVSLLDILLAVDGNKPMFVCTEIRQNGPCGAAPGKCKTPCSIAAEFARAEKQYHACLAKTDLSTLNRNVIENLSAEDLEKNAKWLAANCRGTT